MIVTNLGYNVGTIYNMPFTEQYYPPTKEQMDKFEDKLKDLPFKYVTAITADKYQNKIRGILEKNGFKSIIKFNSSHDCKDETLTLWLKKQNKSKKHDIGIDFPTSNCSVDYGKVGTKRFTFLASNLKNIKKLNKNFERIGKTPIFFAVNDKHKVVGIFD